VTVGTVVALEGEDRLHRLVIETHGNELHVIQPVDLYVIDFLSYELMPARSFECEDLALDTGGFIQVDRRQRTNVPGVFAAGDVTGMPAAVATAVGEGVVAGFEAYRHVYAEKFGAEPPLFAYYGSDRPLDETWRELPDYAPQEFAPELLADPGEALAVVRVHFAGTQRILAEGLVGRLSGNGVARHSICELAESIRQPVEAVRQVCDRLLGYKQITLQPLR
jgi:hypothetical protein